MSKYIFIMSMLLNAQGNCLNFSRRHLFRNCQIISIHGIRYFKYCSLQHQTLLLPPDTSTTECCFCFGPATSVFHELLVIALCSCSVTYWTHSNLWSSSYSVITFCLFILSMGKNTGVGCHFLLQWTTFGQNSSI